MISFTRKQNVKYLLTILVIAVVVLAADNLYTKYISKSPKGKGMYTETAPKNVYDTIKTSQGNQNLALIDFRTPGEFNEEHINGAIWINYFNADYKEKLSLLDKNKTYFIYDKAGRITAKIAKKMKDLGFKEVHRITGGLSEWNRQVLPHSF